MRVLLFVAWSTFAAETWTPELQMKTRVYASVSADGAYVIGRSLVLGDHVLVNWTGPVTRQQLVNGARYFESGKTLYLMMPEPQKVVEDAAAEGGSRAARTR